MKDYAALAVKDYVRKLAERSPVPGGGSAAALAAALGASLNLMVIRYSIKRNMTKKQKGTLLLLEKKQQKGLNRLVPLIDKDCRVFNQLRNALSFKKTNAEKLFIAAAKTPYKVCEASADAIGITLRLSSAANKNLMTDVGCAAYILKSAFSSAALNVDVNLAHIRDKDFVKRRKKELRRLNKDIGRDFSKIRLKIKDK